MSARNGARNQARNRARERMLELNRARAERDERIEQAVTAALLAGQRRRDAQAVVQAATEELAAALRQLSGERVSIADAAQLTELEPAEATAAPRTGSYPSAASRPHCVEATAARHRPVRG